MKGAVKKAQTAQNYIKQGTFRGLNPVKVLFSIKIEILAFCATNKPRHSTYLCTPSDKQKQVKSLVFARFVRSASFFPNP